MIIPKAGEVVNIITKDKTEIEGEVVEWGVPQWEMLWAVVKDETKTFTINMNDISVFYVLKSEPNGYLIENKEDKGQYRLVEAQKGNVVGYNIIKQSVNDDGEIEKVAQPVSITRRIVKQGKAFVDEAPSDDMKLSLDPVERARQQAEQYQKLSQSTRQAVQEHMNRKDLIKLKDNYALPSFKNSSKK